MKVYDVFDSTRKENYINYTIYNVYTLCDTPYVFFHLTINDMYEENEMVSYSIQKKTFTEMHTEIY